MLWALLPLAGSLWHEDSWLPCKERSYYTLKIKLPVGSYVPKSLDIEWRPWGEGGRESGVMIILFHVPPSSRQPAVPQETRPALRRGGPGGSAGVSGPVKPRPGLQMVQKWEPRDGEVTVSSLTVSQCNV